MSLTTYTITEATPAGYESFVDGDKLIMMLPVRVDERMYDIVKQELGGAGHDSIRQILFDCSGMEELADSGIKAFLALGKDARRQDIRILILDAPLEISEQLDRLLPRATWVDSYQQADTALAIH